MTALIFIAIIIFFIQLFRTGLVYGCWALLGWVGLPVGEPDMWASLALALVFGAIAWAVGPASQPQPPRPTSGRW